MAIWRFRISFYKVILGSCLVLLIVLFAGEIFYSFSDEELHFDDAAARVDVIKLKDDSDEPGKEYDFLEVDENWTEGYSEGVLALDITNCWFLLAFIWAPGAVKRKFFRGGSQNFWLGNGGPNFGSERTVELFYGKLLLPPPHTPSLQLRLYVIIIFGPLLCTWFVLVMHQSIPAGPSPPPPPPPPPPPGYCGAFTHLVSPRAGWSIWKKLWKFEGKNCSCIGAPRGRPPPTSPQFHQEMCLDW